MFCISMLPFFKANTKGSEMSDSTSELLKADFSSADADETSVFSGLF